MKRLAVLVFVSLFYLNIDAQITQEAFEFEFEGFTLNGVLNLPEGDTPKGIALIVHGSGRTNAVAQNWHGDIRYQFVQLGYATLMWDKMGCGASEGSFDYNQPVQNSALEVIAAIETLKEKEIPGSKFIGLWGISRAGWINPLVINQYQDIKFWVSVSGVDGKENFKYLLRENLRINGQPEDHVQVVVNEWQQGVNISHAGGTYEEYLEATPNLRENPFLLRFNNGTGSAESYYHYQPGLMAQKLDPTTGLPIYIQGFDTLLSKIKCPVLALFGEKDKNVDWEQTKALYENTLGQNTDLSIKSFPDGNHNLFRCITGGFYEFEDDKLPWVRPEGYLAAMSQWLKEIEKRE